MTAAVLAWKVSPQKGTVVHKLQFCILAQQAKRIAVICAALSWRGARDMLLRMGYKLLLPWEQSSCPPSVYEHQLSTRNGVPGLDQAVMCSAWLSKRHPQQAGKTTVVFSNIGDDVYFAWLCRLQRRVVWQQLASLHSCLESRLIVVQEQVAHVTQLAGSQLTLCHSGKNPRDLAASLNICAMLRNVMGSGHLRCHTL